MEVKEIEKKLENIENLVLSNKDVLTFDEVCRYTGMSRSYLYKKTSNNEIPHSKPFGKMLFFERALIEKWLLQNPIKTVDEIENKAVSYVFSGKKGVTK